MPKNKKKKYNEHKRSKILTDEEEELAEQQREINQFKTKKRHYQALIESLPHNEPKEILTVSEIEFVSSVVRPKLSYEIIQNETISFKGNQVVPDNEEEDKLKGFFEVMMMMEGCKVEISKASKPIKPIEESDYSNPLNDSNHSTEGLSNKEEYKIDIHIEGIASFSLIVTKAKDYVEYSPIVIDVTLKEDERILLNELEIPKGDMIKLINIFLEYKRNQAMTR